MMTKTERVLDRMPSLNEQGVQEIHFGQPDMELVTQLVLPVEDWEDLGEPEQVTVTIVPGDQLN